jgi:hypothetical protein
MRGVQKINGKLTRIAGFKVEDDESSITDDHAEEVAEQVEVHDRREVNIGKVRIHSRDSTLSKCHCSRDRRSPS